MMFRMLFNNINDWDEHRFKYHNMKEKANLIYVISDGIIGTHRMSLWSEKL